ncbi:ABC transporter substrate-binding protein [Paenibacillus thalictri]|uniref:ABC transporter substrate-binding protein n=1 Tax=Paenibacillus thalictri TaxID=2527873 RepID=A0A4Q9DF46_9BACL|nr:ABC transporter substrate-binding protein [Paenibacillus thalictri]TBL68271.1 ABC transporter substrate-binding protein [Paenibacillus thalictri]
MKRNRRNAIACIATAGLLTTAACGAYNESPLREPQPLGSERVELSFYYPVHVGGPLTPTIEGMAEQFMKEYPDIRVKPVYTGSYDDTKVKVQAAVQGKNPPDVAVLQTTDMYSLLDMDAIMPLDAFIGKEGATAFLADFYPAFLANSQTGGHMYSLPFQRSTAVLYYNKQAFKQAGLDPEHPPANWSELAAFAQKLTRSGRWGIEVPSSAPNISTWMFQVFAIQNGKNLISPDGKKVFFNTSDNVEALQFWRELAGKYKAMPPGILEWENVLGDFLQGKTAMMYHTTGNLTNVKNNASFPFGVSFLPGGKQFGTPTGGGNLFIFKGTGEKNQEAAWKFVKWMTDTDRIAQWSIDTGYVAVRKSSYETERLKTYVRQFPAALVARDQLQYAEAELSTHNNDKVTKALNDGVQAVLTGKLSPQEALRQAQEEADRQLLPFNQP